MLVATRVNCRNLLQSRKHYRPPNPADAGGYQSKLQKPLTVPKLLSSCKSCGCLLLPEDNNCKNLLQSRNRYLPPNPADAGGYQRTTIAETSHSPETTIILQALRMLVDTRGPQLQKPLTVPKLLSSSKSCGCWLLPEDNNRRNLLQSRNRYHPPNQAFLHFSTERISDIPGYPNIIPRLVQFCISPEGN